MVLSVSLAFMMPMGTPNLTMIYSLGYIKMKDFVRLFLIHYFVLKILIFLYFIVNNWNSYGSNVVFNFISG